MLIYIILMLALAYFFQKEGQKLLAGKSKLLAEFCQDAYATKTALSTLRILCLSSAVSGFWTSPSPAERRTMSRRSCSKSDCEEEIYHGSVHR